MRVGSLSEVRGPHPRRHLPVFNRSKSVAAIVAKALAAAQAVPSSVAGLSFVSPVPTRTAGAAQGDLPGYAYKRHGITRRASSTGALDPSIAALDCDDITTTWNKVNRSKDYRGAVEIQNDGSDYEQYESTPGGGDGTGNRGGTYYGAKITSRYVSLGTEAGNTMQIQVGDAYIKDALVWTVNNAPIVLDFGTVAARDITFRGGPSFLWAGFAAEQGSIIVPRDFMSNRTSWAFLGDGYLTSNALTSVGCHAPELLMRLCGGGAHVTSAIFGSGYSSAGNGITFDNDTRISIATQPNADVIAVMGGMEDAWPTASGTGKDTLAAIQKVIRNIRSARPGALLVIVSPWAPKQSVAAATGSAAKSIRAAQLTELASTAGQWMHIDPIDGTWRTSNGKTRPSATGAWQTGDGRVGATTGTGNGDTWVANDARTLTDAGVVGVSNLFAEAFRGALSALAT